MLAVTVAVSDVSSSLALMSAKLSLLKPALAKASSICFSSTSRSLRDVLNSSSFLSKSCSLVSASDKNFLSRSSTALASSSASSTLALTSATLTSALASAFLMPSSISSRSLASFVSKIRLALSICFCNFASNAASC